ncbi:unnamed protein product [Miscanthus lutarioriparius]|uniref:Uncharacterized protein n=1 Tax=Miscanthus lutarioriparius TaxID=422564 RepID=A0A811QT49_9POAL|nr:unnamed protein product [Miscanthus lutarioriparius]
MINLLSKKLDNKQRKARDKEDDRVEVDLRQSEGEEHSDDEDGNSVVLKKVTGKGASSGGPIDRFCKLTLEEIVAARKGKRVVADKVQSKISTEKREQKRDRAFILPSFDLMLEANFGRNLRGPSPYEMSGKFLQKRKKKVLESLKSHQESWELNGCTVMTYAWTNKKAVKKDGKYIFKLVDRCIEDIGVQNSFDLMRKFLSRDLVRCGIARFATAYLNLKSLLDNKKQLQRLFRENELNELGYLNKVKGKKANKIVRSGTFWKGVESAANYYETVMFGKVYRRRSG